MKSNTPQSAGLIRAKLPDPQYYNRWIEVGHVQPLDNQNENFQLVIAEQHKELVAQKLDDLVFYFDKGGGPPTSFMSSVPPSTSSPPARVIKTAPEKEKGRSVFDARLWWSRLIYSIRWIAGGFFLIMTVVSLFSGEPSLTLIFAAVTISLLPPVDYFVAEKGWKFTFWRRVLFVIVTFFILAFFQ